MLSMFCKLNISGAGVSKVQVCGYECADCFSSSIHSHLQQLGIYASDRLFE